jgi:tetratricopeptide (TPR) repeat protein
VAGIQSGLRGRIAVRALLAQDGYQVRGFLGNSVRGRTYAGVDPHGEKVVIKAIQVGALGAPNGAELDPRLHKTIRTLKSLTHPCLTNIREVVVKPDVLFVIEDFLPGCESLAQVLSRRRFLEPQEAWRLGCQLCHGLQFMHDRGAMHLRLRPENILLGEAGAEVHITDIGVVALVDLLVEHLDHRPWVADSICPAWLAGAAPAPCCDTYSVGVILREALERGPDWNAREQALKGEIRRFAFLEVGGELAELETELRPLTRRSADALRWLHLRRVVNDACHPEPEARFETAAQLGKAIAAARLTDEYEVEGEATPVPAAEAKPLKRSLVRDAIAFCGKCGRPATAEEGVCRSCGATLPPPTSVAAAAVELGINLEEMRDWFAERGDAMAAAGKSSAAEMAYRLSVYRDPTQARTWADLGDMYCVNRKFDLALNAYQRAVELSPHDPALRLDLGMALMANRQAVPAQDEFIWVLNQTVTADVRLRALLQLGATFAAQKRHKDAVDVWRRCLEERPFDVGIHCSLAASYLALNNYPRAYDHLKMAISANPNSVRARRALKRLDRKQARAAAKWDTNGIALIRAPLFLISLVFGWLGIFTYLLATAAYEVYTRVDLGELWWRLRERRRRARRTQQLEPD